MLSGKAIGTCVCVAYGAIMLTAATPQPSGVLSTCAFATGSSAVTGSCGRLFDQMPTMTLEPSDTVVGGLWRSGSSPKSVWYGEMTDEGYPNAPIQLQIYSGAAGILQTIYGWFPITGYRTTSSGFAFELDGVNEVPPNALDARVIGRAADILSSTAVWNRADDRNCAPKAATFSIYCAGEKAVEEITGGTGLIDHRRPALEVIRGVVDDRSKGRSYHHRLMDYNNDPTTTLADVQSLFTEALRVMTDPAWLAVHGFSTKDLSK